LDRIDVVVRRGRDERDSLLRVSEARDLFSRLVPGELAALTRLRTLRHLDLQLVGKDAVLRRNPEPSRSDLLDPRVSVDGLATSTISDRVLAALTGIALSAEPVHGDRDRFVRLRGNRAVRHGAGREPAQDGRGRLHFTDWHRRPSRPHREQIPWICRGTVVYQASKS